MPLFGISSSLSLTSHDQLVLYANDCVFPGLGVIKFHNKDFFQTAVFYSVQIGRLTHPRPHPDKIKMVRRDLYDTLGYT